MNKWLKIGLPVLIAVLLVVTAVGVTLLNTGSTNLKQIQAAYQVGNTGNIQYAYGPYGTGYGCPAWRTTAYDGPGGWCWGGYN
ncbi:MAG: hypothetical protein WB588_06225 [Dehalococcoidia bacterium]